MKGSAIFSRELTDRQTLQDFKNTINLQVCEHKMMFSLFRLISNYYNQILYLFRLFQSPEIRAARPVVLLILFCLMPVFASAQVLNVESYRSAADTSKTWSGNLSFGFQASKEQTSSLQLNNRSNMRYVSDLHSYLTITNLNVLRIDDELVSNGYVHLRGTFFVERRWSPEAFTQFQYSQDRGLKRRSLIGGVMHYEITSNDDFDAAFTTGGMYEHEVWNDDDVPGQQFDRFKSTSSLLMRGRLSSNTQLYIVGYYQATPGDFTNPRLTADIQLQFQISRLVTFGAQFNTTYDYAPPLQTESWIYSFRNTISLSL